MLLCPVDQLPIYNVLNLSSTHLYTVKPVLQDALDRAPCFVIPVAL